jgi:ADP-ribose pyrophosphatase YjhB (NUDIX family)
MDYIHDLRRFTGPRKLILNAADALIVREGKILFQRRADNGKWGLIGGLLELNETYEEAALREIREETGLEVKLESFLGIFHNHDMVWPNGDRAHVISACYSASILSGEPRIDEESYELRFFGKDEIPPLFAQDHIEELKAYFSGVRYPLLRENSDKMK